MSNASVAYDEGTADKNIDTEQLTVGGTTVQRQRVQIAGTADVDIGPVSATNGVLVNLGANNDVTVTSGSVTAANMTRAQTTLTLSWTASTTSAEVDLAGYGLVGAIATVIASTADLSFTVSNVSGGTFYTLYDKTGTQVKVLGVADDRAYALPEELGNFRFIKGVLSVSQTATIILILKG